MDDIMTFLFSRSHQHDSKSKEDEHNSNHDKGSGPPSQEVSRNPVHEDRNAANIRRRASVDVGEEVLTESDRCSGLRSDINHITPASAVERPLDSGHVISEFDRVEGFIREERVLVNGGS